MCTQDAAQKSANFDNNLVKGKDTECDLDTLVGFKVGFFLIEKTDFNVCAFCSRTARSPFSPLQCSLKAAANGDNEKIINSQSHSLTPRRVLVKRKEKKDHSRSAGLSKLTALQQLKWEQGRGNTNRG